MKNLKEFCFRYQDKFKTMISQSLRRSGSRSLIQEYVKKQPNIGKYIIAYASEFVSESKSVAFLVL